MGDSAVLGWVRNVFSDRFVWFLIAGAGLFLIHSFLNDRSDDIRVDAADLAMLAGRWEAQTGSAPNADELSSLVDYHVREEILAREARRLGLDRDDAILRRRLVQKMELLIRDRYEQPAASDETLRNFFAEHATDYTFPSRVGFRHIYLGPEREVSAADLDRIPARLTDASDPDSWRDLGKPFMLARQFGPLNALELQELFGRDFADALLLLAQSDGATTQWSGPLLSAYGLHLVQVLSATAAGAPSFDAVREDVAADYRAAQLETHEADAWRKLRGRYHVTVATPPQ